MVPPQHRGIAPAARRSSWCTVGGVDSFDGDDGRQWIVLDSPDADPLQVDVVVLSLGHLDALPDDVGAELAAFASDHGLGFVPCGHTAEQDLSALAPGADVLVVGLGQAFTDLVALVTEGRGGRFVEGTDGALVVRALGARAGAACRLAPRVPYRSKLPYRLLAPLAPLPHFLDDPTIEALLASPEPLDFFADVLPRRREGDRLGVLPRAVRRSSRAHDDELGGLRSPL